VIKSRRIRWAEHVACTGEVHTGFWCGDLRERDHTEDLGIDGRIIFKWIDQAQDGDKQWALVNVVIKTFRFHKMQGISGLAEDLLASQEGLCFMELVSK
jgi:hypothetical protein